MKFSLIIPTKDRSQILNKTLLYLSKAAVKHHIQVIVINDSIDPISLDTTSLPLQIEIYNNPKKGVASARNFGASKAVNHWLIFMDDDMLVQEQTFEKLSDHCVEENVCLNANWIYPAFITEKAVTNPFVRYLKRFGFDSMEGANRGSNWDQMNVFRVNKINSAFLLIHKNAYSKVNGYDESFPFAGFEDHDFSERLRKSGATMFVDPMNVIWHNEEDRIKIENWLERTRRGATTRKVAVKKGYEDFSVHYPFFKRALNILFYTYRKPLLTLLKAWPKRKGLDPIYFFLLNRLQAGYFYMGYTQEQQF